MGVRAGLAAVALAVIAGEFAAAARPPSPAALGAVALGALGCAARGGTFLRAAVVLAALDVGAARMRAVTSPRFPAEDVARLALPVTTMLRGRIVAPPERRGRRIVLLLAAESVGSGDRRRRVTGLVHLTIRDPARHWRYGDRLGARATLRRPRNFENPGRFDVVSQLARRGVHVGASVWDGKEVRHLGGHATGVRARLERWRSRLAHAIARAVPGDEGAVLRALVVGDEEAISPELREAFTRAGVVHVLSISGLHVGLVASVAYACARWLLARSVRVLVAVDVARLAAVVSLGPVAVYTALAGLGVATLRSAVMVTAVVLAALADRRPDVLRTLALAALVLALLWPGAPLEAAFQLSFVSVLSIVCGARRLFPAGARPAGGRTWASRVWPALVASPCALAGTAPLTAFHFHQVSLIGLVANPIAIPIFGALVVVVGLVGALVEPLAPSTAAVLFRLAGFVLVPGVRLVSALGTPRWAAVDVPIPDLLELALLYALLLGLVVSRRVGGRVLVAVAVVCLLADAGWWLRERFRTDALRVTFLDVGQGDAAVAELPGGRVVVVDAGGFPGSDFDTGSAIVSPFLLARKILHVDVLAMTHAHPDHSGGLPYLLAHHAVREFWWTGVPGEGAEWERLAAALARTEAQVRVVAAGTAPGGFAGAVEVLQPPPDGGRMSLNDSSLTLRIGRGGDGVLLTGDIEARAEARLLAAPDEIAAAVLKVPHHGSRTSSTPAFVDAVGPRLAVVSVGADNRYGLPSPAVEARYRARGTCVLRTDRCGAITVTIQRAGMAVRTARGCTCPAKPPS